MSRRIAYVVVLSIVLVSCGGTTADVAIDVSLDSLESGTFSSSGDLFDCDGRLETIELHLNEGSTWWIEDQLTCADGSGSLTFRIEGDGAEPSEGEGVGTWTVVDGTGDYEGYTGEGSYELILTPWSEKRTGELTSD